MSNFKMIARADCAVLHVAPLPSACAPLKFSIKTLTPWSAVGSRLLDTSPPSPQVADLQNKANFPFLPTLVSWVVAFKCQAAEPEFGNKMKAGKPLNVNSEPIPSVKCQADKACLIDLLVSLLPCFFLDAPWYVHLSSVKPAFNLP